jgi:hypothetical protein
MPFLALVRRWLPPWSPASPIQRRSDRDGTSQPASDPSALLGAMKAPVSQCDFSRALAHHASLTTWPASLLIQVKTQMPRLPLASQC